MPQISGVRRLWCLLALLLCLLAGCGRSAHDSLRAAAPAAQAVPSSGIYVDRLGLFKCQPPQGWQTREKDKSSLRKPRTQTYFLPPGDNGPVIVIDANRPIRPHSMEEWEATAEQDFRRDGCTVESVTWGTTAGQRSFAMVVDRASERIELTEFYLPSGVAISAGAAYLQSKREEYAGTVSTVVRGVVESIGVP